MGGSYCSRFSVIFLATSKFLIVLVRLILGKVGVDGFTGPGWETDIRYEFDLKILFSGFRVEIEILATIFD